MSPLAPHEYFGIITQPLALLSCLVAAAGRLHDLLCTVRCAATWVGGAFIAGTVEMVYTPHIGLIRTVMMLLAYGSSFIIGKTFETVIGQALGIFRSKIHVFTRPCWPMGGQ